MSFFTPNFATSSTWQSSVGLITSQLRKVKFVVEKTFSFSDFDPSPDWSGMTVTNYQIVRCRGLKIGKMFWYSFHLTATLAAPFATSIAINIPYTIKGNAPTYSAVQYGAVHIFLITAAMPEVGYSIAQPDSNRIIIQRPGAAAFVGGNPTNIGANCFVELA